MIVVYNIIMLIDSIIIEPINFRSIGMNIFNSTTKTNN